MTEGGKAVVWILGYLAMIAALAGLVAGVMFLFMHLWGDVGFWVYMALLVVAWLVGLYMWTNHRESKTQEGL